MVAFKPADRAEGFSQERSAHVLSGHRREEFKQRQKVPEAARGAHGDRFWRRFFGASGEGGTAGRCAVLGMEVFITVLLVYLLGNGWCGA